MTSKEATLAHSHRVAELMAGPIKDLVDRSTCHDRSKTLPPEVEIFDEFTPKLKDTTYGSAEYQGYLAAMGPALAHHYANNRHHPEHFPNGVNGMNLVDLIEMLADWKASTERHADGDLMRSLEIQKERFSLSDQLVEILFNTAKAFVWLRGEYCGAKTTIGGCDMVCNVLLDGYRWHYGGHADGHWDGGQTEWWTDSCRKWIAPAGEAGQQ